MRNKPRKNNRGLEFPYIRREDLGPSFRNEFLKTLWTLRFQKMKRAEERAAWKYQEILDLCLLEFPDEKLILEHLKQLVREERMHEKLAEELTAIVYRSHPECGMLSS